MGVKDLWSILTPLCERKPLFELQGKTVAIDLSCWVVDSQFVTDNAAQPKMYLRNLFFRTANLILQGITPVFVLEGKAPNLKHATIAKRNDARQLKDTGCLPERKRRAPGNGGRSRFNNVLRECQEMLNYMGLKCVQGYGEAEAMCAYLNRDGLVDGCISQDSDCFLYGARVVFRNTSISTQGSHAASGGSMDVYSMDEIEKKLQLGRNKMIALALLLGCDYDEGLQGVGKDSAMKLFQIVKDEDILERMKSWRTDERFDQMEAELSKSNVCTACGHKGNVRVHARSGCLDCCSVKSCSNAYKEQRHLKVNEVNLRKKAMVKDGFPKQELIDEFLVRKGPVPTSLDLKWKQPRIVKFVFFMEQQLGWEPEYSFPKIFCLMTRWQLLYLPEIALRESINFSRYRSNLPVTSLVFPDYITKIRTIKSVASYEICWRDEEGFLEGLIKTSKMSNVENRDEANNKKLKDIEGDDHLAELKTLEPQPLVQKCYPELVQEFEESNATKRRNKKPRRKPRGMREIVHMNEKPAEEGTKRGNNRVFKANKEKKMDEFISRGLSNMGHSSEKLTNTQPTRLKQGPQMNKIRTRVSGAKFNDTLDRMFESLTVEDFPSDSEELNMSTAVEKICKQRISCGLETAVSIQLKTDTINSSPKTSDDKKLNHENTVEFYDMDNYVPLSQRLGMTEKWV